MNDGRDDSADPSPFPSLVRAERRQKFLASVRYRDLVLAVTLTIALFLLRLSRLPSSPVLFGTLAGLWLWNRAAAFLYRRDRRATPVAWISGVLDVGACTLLIGATGGLRSILLPLYLVVIVGAATHVGARLGAFLIFLAAVSAASLPAGGPGSHLLDDPRGRSLAIASLGALLLPVLISGTLLAAEIRARERSLKKAIGNLNALYRIARELSDTLSTDRVIETVVHEVQETFGMASTELFLRASDGTLRPVMRVPASEGNASAEALRAFIEAPGPVQQGPLIYLPIRAKGNVLGILLVEQPPPGRPLDHDDLNTMNSLATQAGVAVENARLYEAKEQLSRTDGLTQLYNHHFFQERVQEEIKRADRFRQRLSLVMLDVDDFKRINDTYGHQTGDQVLRRVARIVRDCLREIDVPARYGGDEFAIILPDTDLRDGIEAAERLRRTVAKHPILAGGTTMTLTISLGVATRPPQSPLSSEELIKMADQALLDAKRRGRNAVTSFPPRT